jgi:DNA-directed RNA polymerase subunit H (RpoH/RPB5)
MKTNMVPKKDNVYPKTKQYVEILGDTVLPINALYSVLMSSLFSLGSYLLGNKYLPLFASKKMVPSYSLLLGILGGVIALVICAYLFKPNRVLTESETEGEDLHEVLKDLEVDPQEEYEIIKNDPVTRKEMELLGIMNKFTQKGV